MATLLDVTKCFSAELAFSPCRGHEQWWVTTTLRLITFNAVANQCRTLAESNCDLYLPELIAMEKSIREFAIGRTETLDFTPTAEPAFTIRMQRVRAGCIEVECEVDLRKAPGIIQFISYGEASLMLKFNRHGGTLGKNSGSHRT